MKENKMREIVEAVDAFWGQKDKSALSNNDSDKNSMAVFSGALAKFLQENPDVFIFNQDWNELGKNAESDARLLDEFFNQEKISPTEQMRMMKSLQLYYQGDIPNFSNVEAKLEVDSQRIWQKAIVQHKQKQISPHRFSFFAFIRKKNIPYNNWLWRILGQKPVYFFSLFMVLISITLFFFYQPKLRESLLSFFSKQENKREDFYKQKIARFTHPVDRMAELNKNQPLVLSKTTTYALHSTQKDRLDFYKLGFVLYHWHWQKPFRKDYERLVIRLDEINLSGLPLNWQIHFTKYGSKIITGDNSYLRSLLADLSQISPKAAENLSLGYQLAYLYYQLSIESLNPWKDIPFSEWSDISLPYNLSELPQDKKVWQKKMERIFFNK